MAKSAKPKSSKHTPPSETADRVKLNMTFEEAIKLAAITPPPTKKKAKK